MTVISDVKKALEATFHMEDRGRLHWFLGLRIRQEEDKVTDSTELLNLKLQTAQNGDEEVDQRI